MHIPGIEVWGPGLDEVGEPECEVSQGDDGVGPDDGTRRLLKNGKQQLQILLTELRAETTHLTITATRLI